MMREAFQFVRDGMATAGVPSSLIRDSETPWPDTEINEKLNAGITVLEMKQMLLVVGLESPRKDLFCAKILRNYMIKHNKNALWLTPPKVPVSYSEGLIPNRGITVVVGSDLLTPFQRKVVCQLFRDRLPNGAAFIVPLPTQNSLEGIYGKQIFDYLTHYAMIVEVNSTRPEIMKV